jgi:outer membrane receptor protein involved in Fe transport
LPAGYGVRANWIIAATAAAILVGPWAQAQTDQSGVLVYQAAFFADARPNTANDMIGRLPGFTFDGGNSARGFAGTAGNVLIDGQRPTAKTDDLQSILYRIPASDVDRIEVIRGGAPGIDMQGHAVIANVIRKTGDSTKIVADIQDNIFLLDGHAVPNASLEFTRHSGDSTYEGSIRRYGNFDDSVGNGFREITDLAAGTVRRNHAHTSAMGTGGALNGAATIPLLGGQFKANLTLQDQPFHSSIAYSGITGDQLITDRSGNRNGELGLHWNGKVGASQLETLILQRLSHVTDVNVSDDGTTEQVFSSKANTGESIARATLRYPPLPGLTLEGGAEGAYNFLDGTSSFVLNGVTVPLPSANARVEERRGEVFAQGTWKFAPDWLLEAGSRFEVSTISETGDTRQSRSFFYPKPRAVLTWTPDKNTQLRLRYERVLGQLDFSNFVASSNLAASGVNAGNPDLKPQQLTQYEFSYERHFWEKGALVATLLHEEGKDIVDYIPVTGASGMFDGPGNIGNGRNNQFDVELTLPLDKLGVSNGLLKVTNIWRFSAVRDPVTGDKRRVSAQRPQDVELNFTQDIDSLKSTWGIYYFNCWDEYYSRLTQVRHRRVTPPFIAAFWEYKPTPDWSIHVELDNMGRFGYEDIFFNYAGPRNTSPRVSIEEISIKSQPRLFIEIRKTFD